METKYIVETFSVAVILVLVGLGAVTLKNNAEEKERREAIIDQFLEETKDRYATASTSVETNSEVVTSSVPKKINTSNNQSVAGSGNTSIISQSPSTGLTWETYMSSVFGFSLSMPRNFTLETVNDATGRIAVFRQQNIHVMVTLEEGDQNLSEYLYLGSPRTDVTSVNGYPMSIFHSAQGYGGAALDGVPYIAFATKSGTTFYNIVFFGDTQLSTTEEAILSSFRLI